MQMMKESNRDFDGVRGIFDFIENDKVKLNDHIIKKYFEPVGLPNLGNTCYMNSLI